MTVRVRFAPSNTGHLHMGSVRTALFNYLFAQNKGGEFILRIEDTDRERSRDEYTEAIIEAMQWLDMAPDEGPVLQTDRFELYDQRVDQLLESGHAYRCYCTPEELEAQRQQAIDEGRKPKYSGKCRNRDHSPKDQPHTVRIKMPDDDTITIEDMVQGEVTVDVDELDDFIIRRTDKIPTYNFVVVVDDVDMDISHVIRGDDHLNNTFRQIPVYRALGEQPPTFAHLPLLSGLSKRKGSASVQDYRDRGFLPEALVNYLSRLGWSHGDQEIFDRQELIEYFDFDSVGRSPSNFDEDKLAWVNSEWMKKLDPRDLARRWVPFLRQLGVEVDVDDRLVEITELMRDRAQTLVELTDVSSYFFVDDFDYDEDAVEQWMSPELRPVLDDLVEGLEELDEWSSDAIGSLYRDIGDAHDVGLANLAQPTRISLTGSTSSPSVFALVAAFERPEVVRRLRRGLELVDG